MQAVQKVFDDAPKETKDDFVAKFIRSKREQKKRLLQRSRTNPQSLTVEEQYLVN